VNGHCIGMELSRGNTEYEAIYYLYESIEDCIDLIRREGFYRFERKSKRVKGIWSDMQKRIEDSILSDRAYA